MFSVFRPAIFKPANRSPQILIQIILFNMETRNLNNARLKEKISEQPSCKKPYEPLCVNVFEMCVEQGIAESGVTGGIDPIPGVDW